MMITRLCSFLSVAALGVSLSQVSQAGIKPSNASDKEVEKGAPAEISVHELNPYANFGPVPGGKFGFGKGGGGNGINYHGGPVMVSGGVNVYLIWYGNWSPNGVANTAQTIIPNFVSHIGGSGYYNINTTYYNGSNVHVPNAVTLVKQAFDSGSQGPSLSDAQIQTVVFNAITGGKLPADSNGVYFVLTSSDVTASSGFCTQYCGWHTSGTLNSAVIKYAFVGNPDRCPSACEAQTVGPNGNAGADGMVSIIAHELEEANTDPQLNAWFDTRGYENADKCAWTFGTTSKAGNGALYNMTLSDGSHYLVQRNWVDAGGGYCAMSY